MRCRLAVFALIALLAGHAAASPSVPLRQLCIDAPAVVMAVPTDPATPVRFRVTAVLRGKGIAVNDEVAPASLTPQRVRTSDEPSGAGKPRVRRVERALLFLQPAGAGWSLVKDGFRFCTDDGRTLAPAGDKGNVEPYQPARWSVLVQRVREDVAAVDQLYSHRRIGRAQRRVEALLGWVQERRSEFTAAGPGTDEAPVGWGRLQLDVFDWIFASAGPEDAWAAIRLYAELYGNEVPRLPTPIFATPAGRALLVRLARDEKLLVGERARALVLLGSPQTLWGRETMSAKEQEAIIDQVTPLLSVADDDFRVVLARALLQLSRPEAAARRTDRAVPALSAAYKAAQAGPARDELAFTVCALVAPGVWKELSENPPGVAACLREFERKGQEVTFWLPLRTPGPAVFEAPQLVLEKLGTFGFVSETKRLPLTVLNLEGGWAAGWKGEALAAKAELPALQPRTTYRVRVEGYVGQGKDRLKWKSEPRKFFVPNQPVRSGPQADYPRIKY